MSVKKIQQEVLQNTPFPYKNEDNFVIDQGRETNFYKPQEIADNQFPRKRVAAELIGEAMNTRAKKILKEFQFAPSGAIQIGTYILNESGDIRISPAGVLGRNTQGETTFLLDSETGDALFKGTIRAGSLISGNIIVGGRNNKDGYISVLDNDNVERVLLNRDGVYVNKGKVVIEDETGQTSIDAKGVVSTANFSSSSLFGNPAQTTTSDVFVDVTGAVLPTLVLPRTTKVLLFVWAYGYNDFIVGSGGIPSAEVELQDPNHPSINLNNFCTGILYTEVDYDPFTGTINDVLYYIKTQSIYRQHVYSLVAGTYDFKLVFRRTQSLGTAFIDYYDIGYVLLGN